MADIELVIKIPEEEYEDIINSEDCGLHRLTRAIAKGTPLLKGHGRLIDADALIEKAPEIQEYLDVLAQTIIEADKEQEE